MPRIGAPPLAPYAQGQLHGLVRGGLVDEALVGHELQHQVAALQGARRVTAGIIIGRALEQAHQQGRLVQAQFAQGPVEVEIGGQAEAVDGPLAVLAKEHFVGIGFQDFVLAVAGIEYDGHEGFVEFAPQAALGGEEEILHQLLGEGAAPLHRLPGLDVGHHGPGDAQGIDPVMMKEIPVLGGQQGGHQVIGQIFPAHQHPVFLVGGIDGADLWRLQAQDIQIPARGGILEGGHGAVADAQAHAAGRLLAIPEQKIPGLENEARA